MSDESKDEKALRNEFEEIFDDIKKEQEHTLQSVFLRESLGQYHMLMTNFRNGTGTPTQRNLDDVGTRMLNFLTAATRADSTEEMRFKNLGNALGAGLSFIELIGHPNLLLNDSMSDQAKVYFKNAVLYLSKMGKSIHVDFLKKRVKSIAKHNQLTEQKRKLLIDIAVILGS